MFHIFYKITNLLFDENGYQKFYLGIYSTNNPDDRYMGSGIYLNKDIKRYGLDGSFVKTTIAFYSDRKSLKEIERDIVDKNFIKRLDVYNRAVGGGDPPDTSSLPKTEKHIESARKHAYELHKLPKTAAQLAHAIKLGKLPKTEKQLAQVTKLSKLPRTEKQLANASKLGKLPKTEKQIESARKSGKVNFKKSYMLPRTEKQKDVLKRSPHIRWHVNRNEYNPDCEFCVIDFYSKQ